MKTERKEVQKIEYVTTYIANDGTEFKSGEECRKYEATAECAINGMFRKLKIQKTEYISDDLYSICSDDSIYAVKIENVEQLEIVNKWIRLQDSSNSYFIGDDAIGTVQLIDRFYDGVWVIGTPEQLKEKYAKAIDAWFDKLIEKAEEPKGENA